MTSDPPQPVRQARSRRLAFLGAGAVVAAIAVTAVLVWLVFFSSAAPAAPTIEGAAAALRASPSATVTSSDPESADAGAADGTWTVDTSTGGAADGSGSWVGFRVAEVLQAIGETEAVGRTEAVSGELLISGTSLEQARIEADLTAVRSDQSRRDPAIQRALETGQHPSATFVSSAPVELQALPSETGTVRVTVPGVLTIHGVSQEVAPEMEARLVVDVVVVVGSLPVDFTAFGITMPRAPVVVSVEDTGTLEWQLYLRRA